MMKKWVILSVIVLVCLAAGYYVWQNQTQSKSLTLYGNVDIRTVNTSFRVSGRLVELFKNEGESVVPGELLAKIDPKPYQISLEQSQAQVAQARAAYDYAERYYQRQMQLIKTSAISQNQLDDSQTAKDQAWANLTAAKANTDQALLTLQDTELYAPEAGTVLVRAVEPGTMLSAGTTVYSVAISQPIWIKAYIDEVNLAQAIPDRKVYIYTDARPNKSYIGHIGFVSSQAEFTPKTVETAVLRTSLVYRFRIVVDQTGEGKADELLRQGMPVTVEFAQ